MAATSGPKMPTSASTAPIAEMIRRATEDAYADGRASMAIEIFQAQAANAGSALPRQGGMGPIAILVFRAMWEAGCSNAMIRSVLGLPNDRAVSNRAHALGFGARHRRGAHAFALLWESGVSADEMATALGMAGAQSVNSRAHALGLPPRSKNK